MGFTDAEILNEVSKIFRGRIEPQRLGGTTDPVSAQSQILELSSLTFLINSDAIYYLARLVANRLLSITYQERRIIEDMLVALEDLPRVGEQVTNTGNLSNAGTALLSLEAAGTVSDRPEFNRFLSNIDVFAEGLRNNTTRGGGVYGPREEARGIILRNFDKLKTLHARLLDSLDKLGNLIDNFDALDIPTKVSSTALSNVRSLLDSIQSDVEELDTIDSTAKSREYLLTTLACKSSVSLISTFSGTTSIKYRSPIKPVPSGINHLGRVAGNGIPATITTVAGPWNLPISGDLQLSVDGGSTQTVDLSNILGGVLNGRNDETFTITSDNQDVNIIVDPNTYTLSPTVVAVTSFDAIFDVKLGFKHLGSLVTFLKSGNSAYPRIINELDTLVSQGTTVAWTAATKTITTAASVFTADHVGLVYNDGGIRAFEIIEYISGTQIVIDPRDLTPNTGATTVRVQGVPGDGSSATVYFTPAITDTSLDDVVIGPTVKSGQISTGTKTVANIVSDLNSYSPLNTAAEAGHVGAGLSWHVEARAVPGDPTKLQLMLKNKLDPYIQVSRNFPKASVAGAGAVTVLSNSAHETLGFREGELDTDDLLTTAELVNQVLGSVSGVSAEVSSDKVSISSNNTGRGSSIEVLSAPSELGVSGTAYGTVYGFEAVNKLGRLLDLSSAAPGDFLDVVGEDEVNITAVDGTRIITEGLPSNVNNVGFAIYGGGPRAFEDLSSDLDVFTMSPNLLSKYGFDEDLDALDAALTTAVVPGQSFKSGVVRAKSLLADLLSILVEEANRGDEYTQTIPTASTTLETILNGYSYEPVPAVDSLVEGLQERKYDRAADLLLSGNLEEFFSATSETASYAGYLTTSAKEAVKDLPNPQKAEGLADLDTQLPISYTEDLDADEDFTDTLNERDFVR